MPTIRMKLPCIETADLAGKGVYASPLLAIFSVIKKGNGMVRSGLYSLLVINVLYFSVNNGTKRGEKALCN